jgi:hypothetical protein
VTEQYTVNLPSTIAFYGKHLNIVIYSPKAFVENFPNSYFIVFGLTREPSKPRLKCCEFTEPI